MIHSNWVMVLDEIGSVCLSVGRNWALYCGLMFGRGEEYEILIPSPS